MKQIDELQDCLDGVNARMTVGPTTHQAWTDALKKDLALLGREKRYWVHADLPYEPGQFDQPADADAWLYDLSWHSYSENNRWLVNIELVMQAEWRHPEAVLASFQKLCQARARFKLMIYQAATVSDGDALVAQLMRQRSVFALRDPGESWLLSCWVAESRGFRHEVVEPQG
jgi:hypothetical protein